MELRVVLLDMGGVLVPETGGYAGAAEDASLVAKFRKRGIPEPEDVIRRLGEQIRDAYRALHSECTQPDLDEVLAELEPELRSLMLDAFRREAVRPPYPEALRIVAELAQRYRLGLVSNTVIPGDHHEQNLRSAGILRHFGATAWSSNFGRRKPDPAIVLHVLEQLDAAPSNAVLVGDKIRTDILAARRAGIPAIWLRRPGAEHTGEAEPDHVIRDLAELPSLIDTHYSD